MGRNSISFGTLRTCMVYHEQRLWGGGMLRPRYLVGLLLLAVLAWAGWQVHAAARVAVGYSAKQLCSGAFVSGLPRNFVVDHDILPRMSPLGPARGLLRLELDEARGEARARLLTASAVAGYQSAARGCTLHLPGISVPRVQPAGARQPRSPFAYADTPSLMMALDAAFIEPVTGGRRTLAVLVAHRGMLVAERYAAPVTATTPLQGWSMNKSLLATWVALLADEGRLEIGQPLRPRLLDLDAPEDVIDAVSPDLTLEHLLRMHSGFAFDERYGPGSNATSMLYGERAMWQSAARTGHHSEPGVRFNYSSGDSNLAAYLWQSALPVDDYSEWLATSFSLPLGLSSLVAEADASGVQVASSYAFLSARDWLAIGQLWLDAWHGRSRLLAQSWQRAAVTPQPAAPGGVAPYGLGFWLNTAEAAFPGQPETLFLARGNAGQYVLVLPEQELVIVRLGLSEASADDGVQVLVRDVMAAVSQSRSAQARLFGHRHPIL